MKIIEAIIHYVEINDIDYIRESNDCWLERTDEKYERVYYCSYLENSFREYFDDREETISS
jgi:hypothetical protein